MDLNGGLDAMGVSIQVVILILVAAITKGDIAGSKLIDLFGSVISNREGLELYSLIMLSVKLLFDVEV